MTPQEPRKPLRIVHTEASCGWGGQEIRILTEASGLRARGHGVSLLCPAESRIHTEALGIGLPCEALPLGRKNFAGYLALRRWLSANRPDVVNSHSSTDSWLAALALSTRGAAAPPLVRTRHISASVPNNLPTRWLYRTASRHVVTTGERLRRQLIAEVGLDESRVSSIPTGIDTVRFGPGDRLEARQALGLTTVGPLIGIVATLRSWKGHEYLLDAFARLKNTESQLIIVGDGPQHDAIRRRITAWGLDSRVTMAGQQRDVVPWLRSMDVFALPSYANEGVPQALMQAMACGLAVISTPVGGITEAITDGEDGILVQPRDSQALAQTLENLLLDPERRKAIGARARETALRKFGFERMLDAMESLFYSVTATS